MATMKKNSVVPPEEQETVIQIDRLTKTATIYTTDSRYINKMDKIYERHKVIRNHGRIAAIEYKVPEKLISYRTGVYKRTISEDAKERKSELAKKLHE